MMAGANGENGRGQSDLKKGGVINWKSKTKDRQLWERITNLIFQKAC